VDDTEAAKISVLGTKGTVDDRNLLNQFRAQRLERTEISLSVPLCSLVLLDIINKNLESAVHASMVEVKSETPNLQRFPSALVLAGINARVQLLKDLIIPREKRPVKNFAVTEINRRFQCSCGNHQALLLLRELAELEICPHEHPRSECHALNEWRESRRRHSEAITSRGNVPEVKLAVVIRIRLPNVCVALSQGNGRTRNSSTLGIGGATGNL
jgi:hypothetical protein